MLNAFQAAREAKNHFYILKLEAHRPWSSRTGRKAHMERNLSAIFLGPWSLSSVPTDVLRLFAGGDTAAAVMELVLSTLLLCRKSLFRRKKSFFLDILRYFGTVSARARKCRNASCEENIPACA